MSKPNVSVVILNYNGRDLMKECVAAVMGSDYKNLDIVIVDNASIDGSTEYLKKSYGTIPNTTVIASKTNTFFTGGFNLGAKKANGELILLLSNDVIVEKNSISELVKGMKHSNYMVQPKILSYGDRFSFDNAGGRYDIFGVGHATGAGEQDHGQYNRDADCDYTSATVFMMNRRFFLSLGGYDEWFRSHYEDVDLCLRARKHGAVCRYIYRSRMFHKISVTYKKYVKPEQLLFDIRKNRLRTVLKNFSGATRTIRLICLTPLYVLNVLSDILSLRPKQMTVTLRALHAALST